MRNIDEREGYCEGCGGIDICICNDIDWTEEDYDYPTEASYGREAYVFCWTCDAWILGGHDDTHDLSAYSR